MEIPQATCHLEFEKDIIEERMEWFYYRVQHMKCGLNYKLSIEMALKHLNHFLPLQMMEILKNLILK